MTKTEAKLIARIEAAKKVGLTFIEVDGAREVQAAKKLAESGLAVFTNLSSMQGGKYYVHPFTGRPATTRNVFVYGVA